MKLCNHCGKPVQDDVQICPFCNASLVANAYAVPSGYAATNAQTSGKAIASLICGIMGFIIPILSAIAAIVLGHLSISEIKKSGGRIKGKGLAIAGLVLGYVNVAMIPIILIIAAIAIPNLLRAKMAANQAQAATSMRIYSVTLNRYAAACPQIGYAKSLASLGAGDPDCAHPDFMNGAMPSVNPVKHGYVFRYSTSQPDANGVISTYGLTADPVNPGVTGQAHFFTDQTGVIRFDVTGPANPNSRPLM